MTNNNDQLYGASKQAIRRSINRCVSSYDNAAVLQTIIGERLFERLDLVKIEPNFILDIGCATGKLTRQLQQRYKKAKVLGVDLSDNMCRYAQKQRKWLAKERYLCADAEKLPFGDNSVELIFSNLMLQWVDNPDQFFHEMQRVLVPGGLIMFTTYGPDTLKEMQQSWMQVDNGIHVNRFIDMHDIGDSLTKSGFNGTVMDNEVITMTYESIAVLHQDLRDTGEVNLNEGRSRALMGKSRWKSYISAYLQHQTDSGDIPASWEIAYGHAWANDSKIASTPQETGFSGAIKVIKPI